MEKIAEQARVTVLEIWMMNTWYALKIHRYDRQQVGYLNKH